MLRTFCPKRALGSLPDFVVGKVSLPSTEIVRSWLVEEWQGIDDCISEQHCRDAALCICACMHINKWQRPSFVAVAKQLRHLQHTMEPSKDAVPAPAGHMSASALPSTTAGCTSSSAGVKK
eukprot:5554388-Amphidinium_carterae.1